MSGEKEKAAGIKIEFSCEGNYQTQFIVINWHLEAILSIPSIPTEVIFFPFNLKKTLCEMACFGCYWKRTLSLLCFCSVCCGCGLTFSGEGAVKFRSAFWHFVQDRIANWFWNADIPRGMIFVFEELNDSLRHFFREGTKKEKKKNRIVEKKVGWYNNCCMLVFL